MPVSLSITDFAGGVVFESSAYFTNQAITVGENFKSGFYILKAQIGEQQKVIKLVKD